MTADLANVMREAISRDGRSLYRIAQDSGIAPAVLSRFVRGKRGLNLDTANRLAKALGLELTVVAPEPTDQT